MSLVFVCVDLFHALSHASVQIGGVGVYSVVCLYPGQCLPWFSVKGAVSVTCLSSRRCLRLGALSVTQLYLNYAAPVILHQRFDPESIQPSSLLLYYY